MSVMGLLLFLVILALVAYLLEKIPGDATIKQIARIVAIVVAVMVVLKAFGVWAYLESIHV